MIRNSTQPKCFSAKKYDECGAFYMNSHRKQPKLCPLCSDGDEKKIDQKHNKIVVKIRRTVYTRPREKPTITMTEGENC